MIGLCVLNVNSMGRERHRSDTGRPVGEKALVKTSKATVVPVLETGVQFSPRPLGQVYRCVWMCDTLSRSLT